MPGKSVGGRGSKPLRPARTNWLSRIPFVGGFQKGARRRNIEARLEVIGTPEQITAKMRQFEGNQKARANFERYLKESQELARELAELKGNGPKK